MILSKVRYPTITALSMSWSEPESISEADADPLFTNTASGMSVSIGSMVVPLGSVPLLHLAFGGQHYFSFWDKHVYYLDGFFHDATAIAPEVDREGGDASF